MWILLFFIAKLQEKVKKIAEFLLRFQRWMKKTNILRARSVLSSTSGNFYAQAEIGIDESQEAKDDLSTNRKVKTA